MSERVLRRTTFSGRLIKHDYAEDTKAFVIFSKGALFMVIDIVIVLAVTSTLFLWFAGTGISPYERPFPCGDVSIREPLYENTVGLKHLLGVTLGSPFFVIALVEAIIFFESKGSNRLSKFFSATTILYLKYLLVYAGCTFAMEFLKCYVGRLRPHFVSVCRPDWTKVDCSNPDNLIYPSDLVCTNPEPRRIRTARTSFPSGHTAAAFHAYIFIFLYLVRMASNTGITRLFMVRNFLLPLYTIWTAFTAISRVTDFWHFKTDVLGGVILAMVFVIPAFYKSWTSTEQIYSTRDITEPVHSSSKKIN